jgi:hypothetical protein
MMPSPAFYFVTLSNFPQSQRIQSKPDEKPSSFLEAHLAEI